MKNEEVRKYSLEDLKQMKKSEIIGLDMRSLPLSQKTIAYFNNQYTYFQTKQSRNPDSNYYKEKDYVFTLGDMVLSKAKWYGRRGDDIRKLCETLGMKQGDIFSFDFIQSLSSEELLKTTLSKLLVPNTKFLRNLLGYHDFNYNDQIKTTLLELLQIDVEEEFDARGFVGCQKVRDYVLKMGFKMGQYPFLNKNFWAKIDVSAKGQKKGIVEGKDYRDFGIESPFAVIMNVMVDKIIVPFEGSYDECTEWLKNHTRTIIL